MEQNELRRYHVYMSELNSPVLTQKEAAAYLKVSESTLNNWRYTKRYDIPCIKFGKQIRYRKVDLDKFISSQVKSH